MSEVLRHNRKGSDRDITRLNALGFPLRTIGKLLDCHPTSITLRLSRLNIEPSDTRRAFMQVVYQEMPKDHMDQLADVLENEQIQIKDYVRNLIEADIASRRQLAPPLTADSIIVDPSLIANITKA